MELSQLPPELLSQGVFKFLSPAEVLRSESVCKWWAQLCRDPTLWHYFCVRDFGALSNDSTQPTISLEMEKIAEQFGWRTAYKEFSTVYWSPEFCGEDVTISENGRAATVLKAWVPMQVNKPITKGKHSYHLTFSGAIYNLAVGVAPPPMIMKTLSNYWCYFEDGNFYSKGVGYGGNVKSNFISGVLTVDVDMDSGLMTFRKNGVPIEDVMCSNIVGPVCLTVSNSAPGVVRIVSRSSLITNIK